MHTFKRASEKRWIFLACPDEGRKKIHLGDRQTDRQKKRYSQGVDQIERRCKEMHTLTPTTKRQCNTVTY